MPKKQTVPNEPVGLLVVPWFLMFYSNFRFPFFLLGGGFLLDPRFRGNSMVSWWFIVFCLLPISCLVAFFGFLVS